MQLPNLLTGKAICLSIFSLGYFATDLTAQTTTTFTYTNSGLNQQACNVFTTPVSINGHSHQICTGGVSYDGTNLKLTTGTSNNFPAGTAYLINFDFQAGTPYTISVNASSGSGTLVVRAGVFPTFPSFVDQSATCSPEQTESDISQASYKNGTNVTSTTKSYQVLSFTPTSLQTYLVIGADDANNSSTAYISSVSITAACSLSAPTGLTTTANGANLNWNAVSGASSYNISVTDNGVVQNLTSNTNSVYFCPAASGDNVSFTVQGVCSGGGTGPASSPYSFTYNPSLPPAPTNLSFNSNSPYTISWDPVPGAAGYYYYNGGSAPAFVTGTSISDPESYLSYNTTYTIQVAAVLGCAIGPRTNFTLTMPPPPPTCDAPIVSIVEGGTFVELYGVSGAISYNVGYQNPSGTLVFEQDNIGTSITSSGYTVTGVPPGEYYVVAQATCSNGATSAWGSPYYNELQTVNKTKTHTDSAKRGAVIEDNFGNNFAGNPADLLVYPNPAHSEVNVVYNSPTTGSAGISITDDYGHTVYRKMVSTTTGVNNYSLNVGKVANGIYVLKVSDGKTVHYQKLVIKK